MQQCSLLEVLIALANNYYYYYAILTLAVMENDISGPLMSSSLDFC